MEDGHGIKDYSPSDEGGSAEPQHGAGGSSRRPYYECTFCKRGFSNAQALGGHMNIHRRDRRQPAAPSVPDRAAAVIDEEAADGYGSHYCRRYADSYGAAAAAAAVYQPAAYAVYSPSSAAGYGWRQSARAGGDGGVRAAPYEMSLSGGDELRLGLRAGGERRRQEVEEDELDLELRLGHRP